MRYSSPDKCRISIDAPAIVAEYSANMGGVDRKDRDSADYTTSIRTTRYYLRIFFWILDSIVHAMYVIACEYASSSNNTEWMEYTSKNGGRNAFQIDMAIQLIDFGIRQDWAEPFSADTKPSWIRQGCILPCDCKICFFCKTGMTSGISHTSSHPVQQQQQLQIACEGKCSNIRKHVQECRVCCFITRSENPNEHWKDAKKKCRRSRKGCSRCQIIVCDEHWAAFSHQKDDYKT